MILKHKSIKPKINFSIYFTFSQHHFYLVNFNHLMKQGSFSAFIYLYLYLDYLSTFSFCLITSLAFYHSYVFF